LVTPLLAGFRNFYPKGSKTPSGGPKPASEGKPPGGGEQGGGPGGSGNQQSLQQSLAFSFGVAALSSLYMALAGGAPRPQEISFQEFKSQLLARGAVARLEVVNSSVARVYLKPSPASAGVADSARVGGATDSGVTIGGGAPASVDSAPQAPKYTFVIGSVDSFERKMDEAQRDLGLSPEGLVPVKYVSEVSVLGTLLGLAPTVLLLGWAYWLLTRAARGGGMPGGGGGGLGGLGRGGLGGGGGLGGRGGGGGFLGMVKAPVGTLDKNAKDKVRGR
jgi:AFG3 family protein